MKKERWKWVDVAKGIAIFLVVFTHAPMFMPSLLFICPFFSLYMELLVLQKEKV